MSLFDTFLNNTSKSSHFSFLYEIMLKKSNPGVLVSIGTINMVVLVEQRIASETSIISVTSSQLRCDTTDRVR